MGGGILLEGYEVSSELDRGTEACPWIYADGAQECFGNHGLMQQ